MARKKRRSRKRSTTARRVRTVQQIQATTQSAAAVAQSQQESTSNTVDFATEYHYVLNDLRRFGILAVAMFATLIVLALILG